MKKRRIAFLWLILSTMMIHAETLVGNCGTNVSYSLDTTTGALVISGTGNMNDYSTTNRSPWYSYHTTISSVLIGEKVTSIGKYAFSDCSGLTSVSIPNSVTSIGSSAFYGCSGIESMTIPFVGGSASATTAATSTLFGYIFGSISYDGGVKVTQRYKAFNSNYDSYYNGTTAYIPSALKSVTVTGGKLFYGAFSGCANLESVNLSDNITAISDYAFYECSGLTSFKLNGNVTTIGSYAFYECSGLASFRLNGNETTIGSYAFYGCSGLTSFKLNGNVTTIGSYAFYGCSGLTSFELSDNVTSIGTCAFGGCSGLTSVSIPNSVTSIGSSAFSGCSGIESITIPFVGGSASATATSSSTLFGYIFGSASYDGGVKVSQKYVTETNSGLSSTAYIPSALKNVTVTGGKLFYGAFYGCFNLKSVILSNNVTSIGNYAFANCSGLTSFELSDNVTIISEHAFANCSGLSSFTLSDNVTSIGKHAFDGCSGLTSFTLCDKVTSIGNYAFANCSGLTSFELSDNVTSISEYAFANCNGLTSFELSDNVTSIGNHAFAGCSGLASVSIPNSVTSIGVSAFQGCSSIESMTIPFVGGSASATTASSSTLFGYIFGPTSYDGGVKASQKYASTSTSWYSVYIPFALKSVTVTGGKLFYGAFSGCANLKSINLSDNITSISNYAFYGCSGLTSFELSDNITSISEYAFYGCSGLTSFTLSSNVTSIGNNAFANCSGLTSVSIPNSVTSIGSSAFAGCSSIESMTIPFVGGSTSATTASTSTLFGYIFGSTSYEGGVEVTQRYLNRSGSTSTTTSYIPSALKNVTLTGKQLFSGAFSGCTNLEYIILSDEVTSISDYAFYGCSGLTSFRLSDNVTTIGTHAFEECSNIASIYIPNSVTKIEPYAFGDALSAIHFKGYFPDSNTDVFKGSTELSVMSLQDPVPPVVDADYFFNTKYRNGYLYVPDDAIEVYSNTAPWYAWGNILPLSELPQNTTDDDKDKDKGEDEDDNGNDNDDLVSSEYTFDFTVPSMLNPAVEPSEELDDYVSVKLITFSKEDLRLSFGGTGSVRLYTTEEGKYELHVLRNATLTITTSQANSPITKILFSGNEVSEIAADCGEQKGATWTGNTTSVTFTANARQEIQTIMVYVASSNVDITDATPFDNPSQKKDINISYTRMFNNTNWQALYVPFSMDYENWKNEFEIARLNDVHQWDDDDDGIVDRTELEVIKMKNGRIDPNTPYVIRVKTIGKKTIKLNNITLYEAQENSFDVTSWNSQFTFVGTYHTITGSEMIYNGYYALGGGSLKHAASENSNLTPFRWYLSVTDREGNRKEINEVKISVFDEEWTSQENQQTVIRETSIEKEKAELFDLSGRKLFNAEKGIYVKNGKKYIVY